MNETFLVISYYVFALSNFIRSRVINDFHISYTFYIIEWHNELSSSLYRRNEVQY